jgi:hypothetical protein
MVFSFDKMTKFVRTLLEAGHASAHHSTHTLSLSSPPTPSFFFLPHPPSSHAPASPHPAKLRRRWLKRSRFSSKGKSTDTIYNVVDHGSNPSHYQLSADIIVIHRINTSYKALQHWLTHLLHCILAETHASSLESLYGCRFPMQVIQYFIIMVHQVLIQLNHTFSHPVTHISPHSHTL